MERIRVELSKQTKRTVHKDTRQGLIEDVVYRPTRKVL